MEGEIKRKQDEVARLNAQLMQLKEQNFSLGASAENNQVKVNNLQE